MQLRVVVSTRIYVKAMLIGLIRQALSVLGTKSKIESNCFSLHLTSWIPFHILLKLGSHFFSLPTFEVSHT